jgi:hypothetical protein
MNSVHVFDTLMDGITMELGANECRWTEGINSGMHHASSSTDTIIVHPVSTSVESPDENWTTFVPLWNCEKKKKG